MTDTATPTADPLGAIAWPVRTERLLVRRATVADAEAIWSYRRLPDVRRWGGWCPATLDELREGLTSRLGQTLLLERDGRVIGELMLRVQDGWAQQDCRDRARGVEAELGWSLEPAAQGQGYATEAVRALLRLCFVDLGLRRVTANAFAANEPSLRLMERVGMRREVTTVRDALHRDLGWVDGAGYAMLAEEWAERAGS